MLYLILLNFGIFQSRASACFTNKLTLRHHGKHSLRLEKNFEPPGFLYTMTSLQLSKALDIFKNASVKPWNWCRHCVFCPEMFQAIILCSQYLTKIVTAIADAVLTSNSKVWLFSVCDQLRAIHYYCCYVIFVCPSVALLNALSTHRTIVIISVTLGYSIKYANVRNVE